VGFLVGATFVLVVLMLFVFARRRHRAGKARGGQEGAQVLEEAQEGMFDQLWAFVMAAGLIIYNYFIGRPAAFLPF